MNMENILLFKTDIRTEGDKHHIKEVMETHQIDQWTVDLEDIDCVLRIVTSTLKLEDVIKLVAAHGYQCEELT